jgi:endogenous inhibitor of DNA gyrase (YacG/DUF329 family)
MNNTSPSPKPAPCPICAKPRVERYRPFCSARCQQVDLGRWFTGRYAIESDSEEDPESEAP